METLHFILVAYGMTFIIVYGKIFEDIRPDKDYTRKWNTLWHCPLCMGFWVGVVLLLLSPLTELFSYEVNVANIFLLGGLSSGTSYILCMLVSDGGLQHEHRSERVLDSKMDAASGSKVLQG